MELVQNNKLIWTIGHSTRTIEDFLSALTSFKIEVLVDVRRYAGSRKYPQFNLPALEQSLSGIGVKYVPMPLLGGRRKPNPNSRNTVWRNEAFRGYADYTESIEFANALQELIKVALNHRTAYMCSEAVWWRCHRAIISDCLKEQGWQVMHIMKANTATEHPYTSAYLQTHSELSS